MPRQRLTLLGATGSIGASTLDVAARHPERFEVTALVAHKNADALRELCRRHRPRYAALLDETAAQRLRQGLREDGIPSEVLSGAEGVQALAALPEVDTVLAAITGAAGLLPTLAAARSGKRVLLANKESLVMGGALFMEAVRTGGATLLPALLPVDSEHNAIFQCLPGAAQQCGTRAPGVRKIILTASGGPFRETPLAALREVTPEQACAHPVWKMGRKISVDSATMMNKGLEVIEAHWLFGMPASAIEVVIHPQSIVHSFVEYLDGSTLAQLGSPDMRTPIAQALAFPERIDAGVTALDFSAMQALTFAAPEPGRFPCLTLAYQALNAGGNAALTLNAANEVAVEAFLNRRIGFLDIASVCDAVLSESPITTAATTVEDAMEFDAVARRVAERHVARHVVERQAVRKGA
ncbi:MAG: 1-deoxy-D-xylulose-5-phosphate reductoisomerase [Proteobacteria bacterium]|nr:1-deoxy-D-xylulose-5-phosphate reductoisomerase [Pseudomonadota bacterium]MCL2307627.1 1-deoxy-D-xylulose-5-phosphate reductoisomerase [Pseudomonadota bacterium]